jgi:hypothetical protein
VATESVALPSPRQAPRAELVLAGLAVLTFALIPVHINTIYSGLPAHPLFLHVPVILIPVVALAALVLVARPRLFMRHGVWIAALTVIALGATDLTMGAGDDLRRDLHLGGGATGFGGSGGPSALIARHAHAASILRILVIVFTAVLLIALAMYRTSDGSSIGVGFLDRLLSRTRRFTPMLRPVLAVLALACLYFVFHTGDLGAKAVWQGRVSGGGGLGGGRPGFGFPSNGGVGIPGAGGAAGQGQGNGGVSPSGG